VPAMPRHSIRSCSVAVASANGSEEDGPGQMVATTTTRTVSAACCSPCTRHRPTCADILSRSLLSGSCHILSPFHDAFRLSGRTGCSSLSSSQIAPPTYDAHHVERGGGFEFEISTMSVWLVPLHRTDVLGAARSTTTMTMENSSAVDGGTTECSLQSPGDVLISLSFLSLERCSTDRVSTP
jgi:hypothetical protein